MSFNDEVIKAAKKLGIGILKQKGDTIECDTIECDTIECDTEYIKTY
jgi:hypothetical protein